MGKSSSSSSSERYATISFLKANFCQQWSFSLVWYVNIADWSLQCMASIMDLDLDIVANVTVCSP